MSTMSELAAGSKLAALTVEFATLMAALALSKQLSERTEADRTAKAVECAMRLTKDVKADNPSAAYENVVKAWQAQDTRFNDQVEAFKKLQGALVAALQRIDNELASLPDVVDRRAVDRLRDEVKLTATLAGGTKE